MRQRLGQPTLLLGGSTRPASRPSRGDSKPATGTKGNLRKGGDPQPVAATRAGIGRKGPQFTLGQVNYHSTTPPPYHFYYAVSAVAGRVPCFEGKHVITSSTNYYYYSYCTLLLVTSSLAMTSDLQVLLPLQATLDPVADGAALRLADALLTIKELTGALDLARRPPPNQRERREPRLGIEAFQRGPPAAVVTLLVAFVLASTSPATAPFVREPTWGMPRAIPGDIGRYRGRPRIP